MGALAITALITAAAALVHETGGTKLAYLHVLYVPIAFGGLLGGPAAGLLAGVGAGIAVGPFMPLDVATGAGQSPQQWLFRMAFFVLVGLVVGAGQHALRNRDEQQRHMQERLTHSERLQKALAQDVLLAGSRERSRVAMRIHDEVIPPLYAAVLQLETAERSSDPHASEHSRMRARAGLDTTMGQLRDILRTLQASVLEPGTLEAALSDELTEVAAAQGLRTHLTIPKDVQRVLPFAVEVLLHDLARGAIANVARHAQAKTLELSIVLARWGVRMEVRDDGQGFDPSTTAEPGHGIALMRRRAGVAGGSLAIDSAPGKGTRAIVEIPLGESGVQRRDDAMARSPQPDTLAP